MMEVKITVAIGNDAMQTWDDVADALSGPLSGSRGYPVSADDRLLIHDANGNTVGVVEVGGGESWQAIYENASYSRASAIAHAHTALEGAIDRLLLVLPEGAALECIIDTLDAAKEGQR